MQKTVLNNTRVRKKERFQLKNVTSLSVSNYTTRECKITIGDVTETLAPFDEANQYARVFSISGDGTCCDVDLVIDPVGAGDAVLRYRTAVEPPKQC